MTGVDETPKTASATEITEEESIKNPFLGSFLLVRRIDAVPAAVFLCELCVLCGKCFYRVSLIRNVPR
jgi:hypothetical protein